MACETCSIFNEAQIREIKFLITVEGCGNNKIDKHGIYTKQSVRASDSSLLSWYCNEARPVCKQRNVGCWACKFKLRCEWESVNVDDEAAMRGCENNKYAKQYIWLFQN